MIDRLLDHDREVLTSVTNSATFFLSTLRHCVIPRSKNMEWKLVSRFRYSKYRRVPEITWAVIVRNICRLSDVIVITSNRIVPADCPARARSSLNSHSA